MKVLVLSCNTGGGHNSAARAVIDALNDENIPCEMLDFLSLASERVSKIVSDAYIGMTKHIPYLFYGIYTLGEKISSPKRKSPVYGVLKGMGKNLAKYIDDNNFDVVVSTHIFAQETLTYMKKKGNLNAKTIFVLTDYTCIPFTEEVECDYCIIPHEDLKEEFVSRGVDADHILTWGIPVGKSYLNSTEQKIAKRELGLDVKKPMFLIMSGSMGFGNVNKIADKLLETNGLNGEIVIICGNNKKQKEKLEKEYRENTNIHIVGFTGQASLYMDACDVLFTKPGGLTSTEAAVKNVPLIHTKPIPGCETKNAQFFSSLGMSYYEDSIDDQVDLAIKLASDKKVRDNMKKQQKENTNPNVAKQIVELIKQITNKSKN